MSRRELARRPQFADVSPELGTLDEAAFNAAIAEDPDAALALLADMAGATDDRLRELARRLAGRLMIDLARAGPTNRRGFTRLRRRPYEPAGGDLDLDASLEPLVLARAGGPLPDPDDLRIRGWERPATALCLVVDRSGSMGGAPLATAAVAAAAAAARAPDDYSVAAFAADVVVVKSQDARRPTGDVITDLLALRGHGTTDLALALRAAGEQLARTRAGRRIVVLLSDCRATTGADPVAIAGALDELWIVAPEGDSVEAEALADAVAARFVTLSGPMQIPAAFKMLAET